ncbi:MAG: bifunctional UDP-N-acetylglucosamine diphosphorylase/glucosamine-1-phosphate N-acetyltransferase GlmU [Rubrivivax sp.]|nr:bifunctional UDP-N-acetylglucosamine diphosphorylase/glucosamine-1-phosphate N-acetyltransferase GlmU [Rubrivivax sp.]
MSMNVVIMAAGKGTRMKSAKPKVLHEIGGRSLLQHVLATASGVGASRTVVVTGHGADAVGPVAEAAGARCVLQMPQLGTGHAMQQAVPALDGAQPATLVLYGDVPLLRADTARALTAACGGERLALLTFRPADPARYGRILRDAQGRVRAIVEYKDASPEQRAIGEVYSGIMAAPTAALTRWVAALRNDNAQAEYYLTDVVAMAVAEGMPVVAEVVADEAEVAGVNDAAQLAELERVYQRRQAAALLEHGVRLADPARLDVRGRLQCGSDVEIDVNCVFEGEVTLGDGARIGANCVIRDASIGAGAVIHPFTHIEGARVGDGALVGPYARLRPGAELGRDVHVGNFVEVKNSTLAAGAKANHLAYLGDATVGERVNYGAGSITGNYDGANKHRTVIGNDVHIGSNCVLVAPITIGDGATVGGGSTVTKSVPPGQLTVARSRAITIPGWQRPKKAPKG